MTGANPAVGGRRTADARLVLPVAPAAAAVAPELTAWPDALRGAGIAVQAAGGPGRVHVDVLVTTAAALRAAPPETEQVIVVGSGGTGRLRGRGYDTTRVFARPGPHGPRLLVPEGVPVVARYVFGDWARPPEAWKRLRNRAVAAAVGADLVRPSYTIAARHADLPYPLRAAHAVGVPSAVEWFLALGDGDDLQRAVFHAFARGDANPGWVVKVARVAGDSSAFDADAAGYALLQRHAPHAAALHTPGYLGRCDAGRTVIAAERAVPGRPFNALLDEPGSERRKLEHIERIARWIVELGRESAAPAPALEPERRRLEQQVLPVFAATGVPADLVRTLPPLPAVLAHHDLGSWNVVVDGVQFGIVDWESARYPALPLGDLLYFLTDTLVALDGPAPPETKVQRALALLRGEHRHSPWCFARLRDGAAAAGMPVESVGPVATLTWLHHGVSPAARAARAALQGNEHERVGVGLLTRLADPWLADPALGPGWPAFRGGSVV